MKRFYPFLLFLIVGFWVSACQKRQEILLNMSFSVNVAQPGPTFPKMENLVESKKQAYDLYGRPDFIRLWWTRDGYPKRFLEVDRLLNQEPQSIYALRHSWIYLDQEVEVIFDSGKTFHEVPLTDKVRMLCRYGDPEDVKSLTSGEGTPEETWHYYSLGLILRFRGDTIISKQTHAPMGQFIKR